MAQFAQFDFDTLKFDRTLIEMIGKGPRGEALLAGLLAMAETVGHQVVAEGVETPEQKAFLTEHGCPIAQGYLFARPMPPSECTAWIEGVGIVTGLV
ncbi:EAL domain-containing protein [Hoeflea sp. G2-23]|uniref:EAL domain-containing protein n=1 Tax=Hoeflea algicola TaxID=2983763 RepID=A0ABT3ZCN8_9HYPH|nr:EAL domain-containing protein [Hoeflea algicola]MCY0149401.1 EAL domain-containing protein [Hoeflea algicola]